MIKKIYSVIVTVALTVALVIIVKLHNDIKNMHSSVKVLHDKLIETTKEKLATEERVVYLQRIIKTSNKNDLNVIKLHLLDIQDRLDEVMYDNKNHANCPKNSDNETWLKLQLLQR